MKASQSNRLRVSRASTAGFTLIELLVVLFVIMILSGLSYPMVSLALAKGKSAECQNNLKQWGLALGIFLDENRGSFPTDGSSGEEGGGGTYNSASPTVESAWFNVLPPYVGEKPMKDLAEQGRIRVPGSGKSMFLCPASPIEPKLLADYKPDRKGNAKQNTYYNSYGYNWWIDNAKGGHRDFSDVLRQSQIVKASIFAVFADSSTGHWQGGEGGGSLPSYRYSKLHPTSMAEPNKGHAFRHAGRANVCFLDGHVNTYRVKQIWFKGMKSADNFGGVQWNPMNERLDGKSPD